MTTNRAKTVGGLPPYPSANSDPHEPACNGSDNPTFASILSDRISRRQILKGSLNAVVASMMLGTAGGALARDGSRLRPPHADGRPPFAKDALLGFDAIPTSTAAEVSVPTGYHAEPFVPWGTPIRHLDGRWPENKPDGGNSGAEQECQVGFNHDGMHYFPLHHGARGSNHGLLCVNHEYVNANDLHPEGPTLGADNVRAVPDEVRKEIAAHGVSVIEIRKDRDRRWHVVQDSRYNRRITAGTPMELSGPVRGSDLVKTKHSPDGSRTRGTVNNCAYGFTPWGTYLTCEENFQNYFVGSETQPREQARYGLVGMPSYPLYWWTVQEDAYLRWDARSKGGDATEDYRNEPNTFGWVVEIDPFDPDSTPHKRTALGRIRHEGAWMAPARHGQPLTVYMGDDQRFEYIYKFVSRERYFPETAGGHLLDEGTLYVARFNADGSGDWLALDIEDPDFRRAVDEAVAEGRLERGFADQADVLVNARSAADAVRPTKMDRPEWGAVDPQSYDVYMTLTNNSQREPEDTNPANPRGPNPYGQIIRWREADGHNWATRFQWELFAVAGSQEDSHDLDGDPLDDTNIFNSPDGLWFDHHGILWIQTDGSEDPPFGNNQMLAADPRTGEIRRFFTGVTGCEVTGVDITPDGRTMFVNVQHPGADWPDGGGARARPSTVIVTREDGGEIGLGDPHHDHPRKDRSGRGRHES